MCAPSSEVDDLFARARVGLDDDEVSPPDNPTGWSAIVRLQRTPTREVLDAALAACVNVDSLHRRIGAAVLGQLGHITRGFDPVFLEERFAGLMSLLRSERTGHGDPLVLKAVCFAFGHLENPRAIPDLLELQLHHDHGVRHGVASALSHYGTSEAIGGLIALSGDIDDDVRDWATFGLGQIVQADTPAIRAALHARLDDPCHDARNEAIEGLAIRGDRSVVPVLIRELHQQVSMPLLDAATALALPELCGALSVAAEHGLVWEDAGQRYDLTSHWIEARKACGC